MMEWQTIINIGGASLLATVGWFARQLWDSVSMLRNSVHQIEVSLPTHYVKRTDIDARFDRVEAILDKIFDRLEQKVDR